MDGFNASTGTVGDFISDPVSGPPLRSFHIALFDENATAFSDSSVPIAINLSEFERRNMYLNFFDTVFTSAQGEITSFELLTPGDPAAVPEPTSLALLGLGVIGGAIRVRRKRHLAQEIT